MRKTLLAALASLLACVGLFCNGFTADADAEESLAPTTRPAPPSDRATAIAASVRSAMRRPTNLDVKNLPLDRAIASLSRQAFVPISVDWEGLRALGVERDSAVTLQLAGVPADHVLALLLQAAGASGAPSYDAGGVRVAAESSSAAGPDGEHAVKSVEVAYDVADLLRLAPRWFNSRENVYDDISRLIELSVASDSWKEFGGTIGEIRVGLAKPREEPDADAPAPPAPRRPPPGPGRPIRWSSRRRQTTRSRWPPCCPPCATAWPAGPTPGPSPASARHRRCAGPSRPPLNCCRWPTCWIHFGPARTSTCSSIGSSWRLPASTGPPWSPSPPRAAAPCRPAKPFTPS